MTNRRYLRRGLPAPLSPKQSISEGNGRLVANRRALLKAAGFDTSAWDDFTETRVACWIGEVAPSWAISVSRASGWRWPLRVAGVTTAQGAGPGKRQRLSIRGPGGAVDYDGEIR